MLYYQNNRRRADFKRITDEIKEELIREERDPNEIEYPELNSMNKDVVELPAYLIQGERLLKKLQIEEGTENKNGGRGGRRSSR